MLARVEIETLYLLLRFLKRTSNHFIFYRFVLGNVKTPHHLLDGIYGKNAHQGILERNKKLCSAGIALPSGAPAQLIVYAPSVMPFGAEHKQAAQHLYCFICLGSARIAAKLDIDAAAGHVGGQRH